VLFIDFGKIFHLNKLLLEKLLLVGIRKKRISWYIIRQF